MAQQKIFPQQIDSTGSTTGQVLVSDGNSAYWGGAGGGGGNGYTGSVGYTGSASTVQGPVGYTGSIGYTGSAVIGLTSNATDTVTLSSGYNFVPATTNLQDLGSPDFRFNKLYLAAATIDLGGTLISAAEDNTVSFKTSAGEPAPMSAASISFGNTANTVTMQIDPNTNTVIVSSPTGTTAAGYSGSNGLDGYAGSSGYAGSQGVIGFTGSQGDIGFTGSQGEGFTGSQGATGFTGSKGADGSFGGAAFDYKFSNVTTDLNPGNGYLSFNNSLLSSATVLRIDYEDINNTSAYSFLQTIDDSTSAIKGHFSIVDKNDPNNYVLFAIIGAHYEDGNHFDVPISYLSGITSLTDQTEIIITFARTGNVGDKGDRGDVGYTGSANRLTVSLINTDNSYSNIVSNVNTLRFDTDAGFDVTDLSNGEVKIGMNSTFKYWDVDGQETLVAEGIDRIHLIAGDNITLTTEGYVGSTKALTISATMTIGYTGSASTVAGYTGSAGVKGDPGLLYWSSSNW